MKRLTIDEYQALPRGEKAVLLAKDVIAQVAAKGLTVRTGAYCSIETGVKWVSEAYGVFTIRRRKAYDKIKAETGNSAQTLLKKGMGSKCHVCAKGALFMSRIKAFNGVTIDELDGTSSEDIADKLVRDDEAFSTWTFDLIETAFEQIEFGVHEACQTPESDAAIEFGERFAKDRDRLVAIMLNVIQNKGEFDPYVRITRQQVRDALRPKVRR